MLEPEIVKQIRALTALGWGKKRIARELGIARNSVRRYVREGEAAETQTRPGGWTSRATASAYDRRNELGFSARERPRTETPGWGQFWWRSGVSS